MVARAHSCRWLRAVLSSHTRVSVSGCVRTSPGGPDDLGSSPGECAIFPPFLVPFQAAVDSAESTQTHYLLRGDLGNIEQEYPIVCVYFTKALFAARPSQTLVHAGGTTRNVEVVKHMGEPAKA